MSKAQDIKLTLMGKSGLKVIYTVIQEAIEPGDKLKRIEVIGEPYELPEDFSWGKIKEG